MSQVNILKQETRVRYYVTLNETYFVRTGSRDSRVKEMHLLTHRSNASFFETEEEAKTVANAVGGTVHKLTRFELLTEQDEVIEA